MVGGTDQQKSARDGRDRNQAHNCSGNGADAAQHRRHIKFESAPAL